MAQHPNKLKWRDEVPYGLSASQFGMALGHCGRIVDYVDYLRNVVGTHLEFTGNASTSHGIATEPKSRSLYELLTGSEVVDGGFFHTEDRLLGCSPDGRIFLSPPASPRHSFSANNTPTSPLSAVSVRIPFKSKRRVSASLSRDSQTMRFSEHQKCRLLEIKSPFCALYDGSKPAYQPFGIPLHYLCQIQGQMAIAECDECDFFVYLDQPVCQVVAWRVQRSVEFWEWAHPKLRQVIDWVRDGPPSWLNRTFEFEPFDYSKISVSPLVFPFDITSNKPISDPKRFPFFHLFQNPFDTAAAVAAKPKLVEMPGIDTLLLRALSSPITRFLFYCKESDEDNSVLWCSLPCSDVHAVEDPPVLGCWNTLLPDNADRVKPFSVEIFKPTNFDEDEVTCSIAGRKVRVSFWRRAFLTSLVPSSEPAKLGSPCAVKTHKVSTKLSKKRGVSLTSNISVVAVDETTPPASQSSSVMTYSAVEIIDHIVWEDTR